MLRIEQGDRMEPAKDWMDDLRAVITGAEELLRATADQAGPGVQEARERAEESLRHARERLQSVGGQLDAQVREHPWAAVGIAAGIGLIVGILVSRK
jgi:ElaB/YqjD/DUF883 family membrane-anchored ribosome-binding protein